MNLQLGKRIEEKKEGGSKKGSREEEDANIFNFARKQSLKPILELCNLSILLRFCRKANTNFSS